MRRHYQELALVLTLLIPSSFAKKADTVFISSNPNGATVEADGRIIGTTPFEWKVGNHALNPKKGWLFSKHLDEPVILSIFKAGYVRKTVSITEQMEWYSMDPENHFTYFIITSEYWNFELDKIGDFFGENPFREDSGLTPYIRDSVAPIGSENQLSAQQVIRNSLPAVVTIQTESGQGSGFVISDAGVVVTNRHVVGSAGEVVVVSSKGEVYRSRKIYIHPNRDLALVKLEGVKLPYVRLADPARLEVGSDVIAIGTSRGYENTVTRGIVSAFRKMKDGVFLQTDTPINDGNSGGPLLDLFGDAVGVNTRSAVGVGTEGLHFAVSVAEVLTMLKETFGYVPPYLTNDFGENRRLTENTRSPPHRADRRMDSSASSPVQEREPVKLGLGMSRREVEEILGSPVTLVELGQKTIYRYPEMQIEFESDALSNLTFNVEDEVASSRATVTKSNDRGPAQSPSRLFVFRKKFSKVKNEQPVYLDDQLVATLNLGYFLTVTIPSGEHSLSSHNSMKKVEMDFFPGEDYCFEVVTNLLGLPSTKWVENVECRNALRGLRLLNEFDLTTQGGS